MTSAPPAWYQNHFALNPEPFKRIQYQQLIEFVLTHTANVKKKKKKNQKTKKTHLTAFKYLQETYSKQISGQDLDLICLDDLLSLISM